MKAPSCLSYRVCNAIVENAVCKVYCDCGVKRCYIDNCQWVLIVPFIWWWFLIALLTQITVNCFIVSLFEFWLREVWIWIIYTAVINCCINFKWNYTYVCFAVVSYCLTVQKLDNSNYPNNSVWYCTWDHKGITWAENSFLHSDNVNHLHCL